MKFLLLITLAALPIFSGGITTAQEISGKVVDKILQRNIADARIVLINTGNGLNDTVYTNAYGNWTFQLNVLDASENEALVRSFSLEQNYPNPFNPSTQIVFSLAEASDVTLTIHNVLGEQVDSRSAFLDAGGYKVTYNGSGAAGIYFYTLQAGSSIQTKKMIQLDGSGSAGGLGDFNASSFRNPQSTIGKISQIDVMLLVSAAGFESDTIETTVSGGENIISELTSYHHLATLIDLHNDVLEKMAVDSSYHLGTLHNYNHTDIPRMQRGGVDAQFFAVWVSPYSFPDNPYQEALRMIGIFNDEMAMNPETIGQADSPEDLTALNDSGKIAAILAVEGGHTIENSIDNLITLYNAGMRYMTITWNNSTDWAISAQDPLSATVGLSDFGRQVIRTMDSLGIIIDVSHTGIKTIEDILEETTNPIVATHSGARALQDHYRNLTDDQIIDIANTGGVVGIVFYPPFLGSPSSSVNIQTVIDHIDYIVNLVGIDYVALGSDFDGIGTNTVNGLEDISKFPALTFALFESGYTREEIEKILGKNFMRVFNEVCGSGTNAESLVSGKKETVF